MKITVVTILPEVVDGALTAGVVGRARDAGLLDVATVNPRDFTHDKHRTVDDTPYGGGPGMVMKPEPLLAAIDKAGPGHRIYMSPAGRPLTQARVRELSALPHLVLVCGRYEGIDERVIETAIDEEISLGDYVLSGGELGALVVLDAVARLVPGVLGEATSVDDESHSAGLLEYPQYTRPLKLVTPRPGPAPLAADASSDAAPTEVTREVPAVLTSGNHAVIAAWRRQQAVARTARRRPDMFARFTPTKADRKHLPPPLSHRTHLALVHYPCLDRTGAIVTTSVTNFDIHDLARSSLTYGLAGYHIVTPITVHREKAAHIAQLWMEAEAAGAGLGAMRDHRSHALRLVRTADSLETVISDLTTEHGLPPFVVASSARRDAFPGAARRTPADLVADLTPEPAPVLLLLGTGWGLAEPQIPAVSHVLTPIEGASAWNHLSVRSAGAILLDRMFGC